MVWLSKMGKSSSKKDHPSFFCQEWRKGSKDTSYVIIGITLKFLEYFKRGQGNCARCDQGPGMDEGGADYIGMPRIHAPYCQVWFLNIHKDEGVSWFLAAEGNEGDVIDKYDSRCSQVPWIDVRVVSSGLSHSPSICTTVLVHRATLITVQAFYVKSCV